MSNDLASEVASHLYVMLDDVKKNSKTSIVTGTFEPKEHHNYPYIDSYLVANLITGNSILLLSILEEWSKLPKDERDKYKELDYTVSLIHQVREEYTNFLENVGILS